MTSKKTLAAALLAVASLLLGCDGDNPRGHLLDGAPPKIDRAAEDERLRRMQLLRVIDPAGASHELEVDGPEIAQSLLWSCDEQFDCLGSPYGTGDLETCHQDVCRTVAELCKGQFLMRLVTDPMQAVLYQIVSVRATAS